MGLLNIRFMPIYKYKDLNCCLKEGSNVIITNNIMALNAHRQVTIRYNLMMKSMERLSTGLRINRAADDPAGLAISERMRAQIRGLKQASRNAQDGISLLQVAEGALDGTTAILHRIRELCVQAATGTYNTVDLEGIQNEIDELIEAINGISSGTEFNGKSLLNGSVEGEEQAFILQIGANAGQNMTITLSNMSASALGIDSINILEDADGYISIVDDAIQKVSSERSKIGAYQNRLEHTINNLENNAINLQAAESRIRDADIAEEMMSYVKNSILLQVAIAMLAQANMIPQLVLQLLKPISK